MGGRKRIIMLKINEKVMRRLFELEPKMAGHWYAEVKDFEDYLSGYHVKGYLQRIEGNKPDAIDLEHTADSIEVLIGRIIMGSKKIQGLTEMLCACANSHGCKSPFTKLPDNASAEDIMRNIGKVDAADVLKDDLFARLRKTANV